MVILFLIFLAVRLGLFKTFKEGRKKRAEAEAARLRRERKQARLEAARQRQETERRKTAEILTRAAPGLRQKSVTAAGQQMWFLEEGPADGPMALLLHGFAGSKEDWAEVARRLVDAGYHVVAPDLPGFGQNERNPDWSYDVTTQVKRIRAFTQQLGIEQAHLVGCSIGAVIAAAYVYAKPEDALSLTLIEPLGIHVPYPSELDEMLAQGRNPLLIATPQAYDNLLGFLYVEAPDLPPPLKRYRATQAAEHRAFYLKMWQEACEGERAHLLDMLLPEIKTRTLVLLGAESRVVHGATVEAVQAMMADRARTAVIEGCGHLPMAERPEETADRLLAFLGPAAGEALPKP